jgi:hypothetical protein
MARKMLFEGIFEKAERGRLFPSPPPPSLSFSLSRLLSTLCEYFERKNKDKYSKTMSKVVSVSTKTAALKSSRNNAKKRKYEDLTRDELIAALQKLDAEHQKLQTENKRLKQSASKGSTASVDPEKLRQAGLKLRSMAVRGIKSQMKWKPSCKYSKARFSWSSMCDEATFRAFRGLKETDKKKGTGKMSIEDFESLVGTSITTSIRYGYLSLVGENVNITYGKDSGELKVTGYYGL